MREAARWKGLIISREIQNAGNLPLPAAPRGSDRIPPGGSLSNSVSKKGPGHVSGIVCVAVLLFIFLATLGAGSMKQKKEEVELAGKVYLMGNEPFTQVGLKTDDGEAYVLQGEHEKELRALQGKRLSVKGTPGREKVRGAKAVEVKSYRVLE